MAAPLDELIASHPYRLIDMDEVLRIANAKATFLAQVVASVRTKTVRQVSDPEVQKMLDEASRANLELLRQHSLDGLQTYAIFSSFIRHQAARLMEKDTSLFSDVINACSKLRSQCDEGTAIFDGIDARKKAEEAQERNAEELNRVLDEYRVKYGRYSPKTNR